MTTDTIRITGKLISDTELRLQRTGIASNRYLMTIRLRQEQGLPYVASMPIGHDPSAMHAASRKALAMVAGQFVTVTGTHIDLTGTRDGAIALLIQGVTDIAPHIAPHHSEKSSA